VDSWERRVERKEGSSVIVGEEIQVGAFAMSKMTIIMMK